MLSLPFHPVDLPAEEPSRPGQAQAAPAEYEKKDTGEVAPKKEEKMLTLSQCIEIARKKNPNIVAAVNTVSVNQSRVGEARAGYYPQLTWSSGYNRTNPVLGTTGGVTGRTAPYNYYTSSVTLSQNILDFGKTSSQVDIQKFNLEASRSDFDTTSDQIIFNVKQAYYGVLQAKRSRDVALAVVKQFRQHLEQARGFYQVGTKPKIDVTRAEVDLSNAQLSLIRAENAQRIAWVVLNNAMGVPEGTVTSIEDDLSIHKFTITFEEALERAFANRPDLQSLVARKEASQETITFARKGYYPVLTGNASYNWAGTDLPLDNGWNVGVLLTFPLFSGFLTTHQVGEAKASLYVLQANEDALRQQIVLEIRQAYLNLGQAEDSISTAELAVKQAEENLGLANGRYDAGVGSPIEVTDAFAAYTNVQASYTSALYDYKIAQANIEKAMGAR